MADPIKDALDRVVEAKGRILVRAAALTHAKEAYDQAEDEFRKAVEAVGVMMRKSDPKPLLNQPLEPLCQQEYNTAQLVHSIRGVLVVLASAPSAIENPCSGCVFNGLCLTPSLQPNQPRLYFRAASDEEIDLMRIKADNGKGPKITPPPCTVPKVGYDTYLRLYGIDVIPAEREGLLPVSYMCPNCAFYGRCGSFNPADKVYPFFINVGKSDRKDE